LATERVAFSRVDRLGDPREAIQGLVERVCSKHGGAKQLSTLLPVGYAQIRRWVGDGGLPGLDDVLELVRLAGPDDSFRGELIDHLRRMFDPLPEEIAERVRLAVGPDPVTGDEAAEAILRCLRVVEITPGRWVRG
jgi:hypothetical protein